MSKPMMIRTDLDGARKALLDRKQVYIEIDHNRVEINAITRTGFAVTVDGILFDTPAEYFISEIV